MMQQKHKTWLELECSECQKVFMPKNQGLWYRVIDGNILLTCPACYEKWENQFEVVNAEFSDSPGYGLPMVTIYFKNGQVLGPVGYLAEQTHIEIPGYEIPMSAKIKIKELARVFWQEKEKQKLKTFRLVDTFDEQYIYAETNAGDQYKIRFKYGRYGEMILDPNTKLPEYVLRQIEQKMRE
ncbi:hypothetical protein [Sporolituus thermophilus]|uniref:Uncharacterized protein n=1 Tax=Sporolituus thermophilus DSM 23256 TaxID=1123285 RepID=A0A1G7PIQ4_9FIRM|nr:hypothetical protein [Sporolituus thermophilus]SDF86252.1 hypothetical protein SAMN05660235_02978 [Sporolituus thermophilus DSM 23256]